MANKDQATTSPVTFDVNDPVFQQIVAQAVAVRLAAIEAEKPVKNTLVDGKTEGQLKMDVLVCQSIQDGLALVRLSRVRMSDIQSVAR